MPWWILHFCVLWGTFTFSEVWCLSTDWDNMWLVIMGQSGRVDWLYEWMIFYLGVMPLSGPSHTEWHQVISWLRIKEQRSRTWSRLRRTSRCTATDDITTQYCVCVRLCVYTLLVCVFVAVYAVYTPLLLLGWCFILLLIRSSSTVLYQCLSHPPPQCPVVICCRPFCLGLSVFSLFNSFEATPRKAVVYFKLIVRCMNRLQSASMDQNV